MRLPTKLRRRTNLVRRRCYHLVAATVIAGCVSDPIVIPPVESEPTVAEVEERPPTPQVETYPAGNESLPAIVAQPELVVSPWEYLARAESAVSPQRERDLLQAAAGLVASGDFMLARRIVDRLESRPLPSDLITQRNLVIAQLAQRGGNHQQALRILAPAGTVGQLDPDTAAEIYRVRADSFLTLNRNAEAIVSLAERGAYLVTDRSRRDNQQRLWFTLQRIDADELRTLRATTNDSNLSGWLDLALLHRETPELADLSGRINNWQRVYPGHPATPLIASIMGDSMGTQGQRPRQIALLLPLASTYGKAAQAVYEGFTAMHEADLTASQSNIVLYDTGAEEELAAVYYQLAIDEGAEFVVGPLGKKSVDALVVGSPLGTPTLLLGNTDQPIDPNQPVFQMGLPPEEEAEQVARRAYADGHRFAAVLYPNTPRGQRMDAHFRSAWQALGGISTVSQQYVDTEIDHSQRIKQLLNIDESELRQRRLATLLRANLEFKPRRRRDIDFIFMVANYKQGRLLKPQINFFHGHDVPVYSTSDIYAGRPNPILDADLNGIVFGGMPWMLAPHDATVQRYRTLQGDWHGRDTRLDRIYALGADAYNIIPTLNELKSRPGTHYQGLTAILRSTPAGRLKRELQWARFIDGEPEILGPITLRTELPDTNQFELMAPTPTELPEINQIDVIAPTGQTPTPGQVGGTESL